MGSQWPRPPEASAKTAGGTGMGFAERTDAVIEAVEEAARVKRGASASSRKKARRKARLDALRPGGLAPEAALLAAQPLADNWARLKIIGPEYVESIAEEIAFLIADYREGKG